MAQFIGTIITDCSDGNARTRQELRFESLLGVKPSFFGVSSASPDIDAAGNLIDQLDALIHLPVSVEQPQSVILVNVAPRGDYVKKRWDNGTPFCYFKVGNALVFSAFEGRSMGLAQLRGLVSEVELFDIPTVMAWAIQEGLADQDHAERVVNTQFRSLEFLPLVASWVVQGKPVPAETTPLESPKDIHNVAWHIDNFGNVKTTLVAKDIAFEEGKEVKLTTGEPIMCHKRLADVPEGNSALVLGSSGYGADRFVELVVARGNAAQRHSISIGSPIVKESELS